MIPTDETKPRRRVSRAPRLSPAREDGAAVRVVTPSGAAAVSLVQEAVGLFRAELVERGDGAWEVHFHQDRDPERLAKEVISLVSRWLSYVEERETTVWLDGQPYRVSASVRRNYLA